MSLRLYTVTEAEKFIRERHTHWHAHLAAQLQQRHGIHPDSIPRLPTVEFTDKIISSCGFFDPVRNACSYSLPYAMVDGPHTDDTVAHEVTHAFVLTIGGTQEPSHGALFFALLREICGFADATASANYTHDQRVEALLIEAELARDPNRVQQTIHFGRLPRMEAGRASALRQMREQSRERFGE